MTTSGRRGERRADALSKEKIVAAAVQILDSDGEAALTFRALSARLATGSGAIYWHVANKDDLLAAATNDVIAQVMVAVIETPGPEDGIRSIALGVFDAIDEHPWVGGQLARAPSESAMLQIYEGIGGRLETLGVSEDALFSSSSALVNYVLGVAVQNAANARLLGGQIDRSTHLSGVAQQWADLDPENYPFLRKVSSQLSEHDDREQFLAGVDLFLAGIATTHRRPFTN